MPIGYDFWIHSNKKKRLSLLDGDGALVIDTLGGQAGSQAWAWACVVL